MKTFVTALGLAVLLAGPALAQVGAQSGSQTEPQAAPAPMQQNRNNVVQTPGAPAKSGGFSQAAAAPNGNQYPPTGAPSSPRTTWQFGPWVGQYPSGQ